MQHLNSCITSLHFDIVEAQLGLQHSAHPATFFALWCSYDRWSNACSLWETVGNVSRDMLRQVSCGQSIHPRSFSGALDLVVDSSTTRLLVEGVACIYPCKADW